MNLSFVRTALSEIDARVGGEAARVSAVELERKNRVAQKDRDVAAVGARIRAADEQASRDIDAVKRRLEKECGLTQKRLRQVGDEEQTALAKVARTTGARATGLRDQLRALAQDEARESATALAAVQSTHVRNVLSSSTVAQAQISGVGPNLKGALMSHGIKTAQDVDQWKVYRIPGFGPARVSAIVAWAKSVEQRAKAAMPQALPASEAQALRANYEWRRQSLAADLKRAEDQQRTEEAAIRAKSATLRQDLVNLETAHRTAAQREIQAIQERRDQAVTLLKREEEQGIEAAEADLARFDARITELKRSSFTVQWERARAASRVKAYAPVTFANYLRHVALGSGSAG